MKVENSFQLLFTAPLPRGEAGGFSREKVEVNQRAPTYAEELNPTLEIRPLWQQALLAQRAEGKTIQFFTNGEWLDIPFTPTFDRPQSEYRIKEWWSEDELKFLRLRQDMKRSQESPNSFSLAEIMEIRHQAAISPHICLREFDEWNTAVVLGRGPSNYQDVVSGADL